MNHYIAKYIPLYMDEDFEIIPSSVRSDDAEAEPPLSSYRECDTEKKETNTKIETMKKIITTDIHNMDAKIPLTPKVPSIEKKLSNIIEHDDPVILKAVANVNLIQKGQMPRSDVLNNTEVIGNGKKIKITQQLIENAYKKLRVIVVDKKINAENMVLIAAYALQIANEMLTTSKTYKVELTLAILRKLIDDDVEDDEQKMILHMLVESTVPSLINTLDDLPSIMSNATSCCIVS